MRYLMNWADTDNLAMYPVTFWMWLSALSAQHGYLNCHGTFPSLGSWPSPQAEGCTSRETQRNWPKWWAYDNQRLVCWASEGEALSGWYDSLEFSRSHCRVGATELDGESLRACGWVSPRKSRTSVEWGGWQELPRTPGQPCLPPVSLQCPLLAELSILPTGQGQVPRTLAGQQACLGVVGPTWYRGGQDLSQMLHTLEFSLLFRSLLPAASAIFIRPG